MMGAAMLKHHQFVRSLWALYRLVVSSITWGSQAQPLLHKTLKPQPQHNHRENELQHIITYTETIFGHTGARLLPAASECPFKFQSLSR